jgi:phosphate ABC transporter phosphate-binding protein
MSRNISLLSMMISAVLVSGCGGGGGTIGGGGAGGTDRLDGAGSSFVYPMMSKWASEYQKAKGVKVNYQSIGSGGGIQQMTAKTVNFGCTDAPLNDEQLEKAKQEGGEVVHIPLVMGGVVPIYNLPDVQELRFTGPVLADIFLNKIKKWNDPALTKLNPNAKLPDQEILVVHRSEGSGTTYIWVEYLSKVSDEWKKKVGVGTSVNWPTGAGAKGSEGVSGAVARSPGSISYVELIYALQNKIKYGSVQNREGNFVEPSLESVTAACNAALTNIRADLRYSLTDAPGKDSYPISGTVWAVVYVDQPAGKGKAVVDFLRWVTHDGQAFAKALQYATLPEGLVKRVDEKLAAVKAN